LLAGARHVEKEVPTICVTASGTLPLATDSFQMAQSSNSGDLSAVIGLNIAICCFALLLCRNDTKAPSNKINV
jgi:hypothetical protein